MLSGIIELDLHKMNKMQAKTAIDNALQKAGGSVYRIRLIHGYHGGTELKRMILDEYSYGRHEKVIRIVNGTNPGITELILKELY